MTSRGSSEVKTWSVSDVNRRVKQIIESQFHPIWVEGEISNFTRHSSGHLYFSMKDEKTQLRCVMFRSSASRLTFAPVHGMQVSAYGNIGVFETQGSYQLYVEKLRPSGLGALHQAFENLKNKLHHEGLFDPIRKKPLPRFPQKIGIVTSPTGAAIRDIVNIISRRFPIVRLQLYPARVQGSGAATEIVQGIHYFNNLSKGSRPGVLIVGRGGGSLEDLWPFNEESVARAISDSSIPIISAVGHEIDFTIADFISDLRAPTPSAAAELAVPDILELKSTLEKDRDRLTHKMGYLLTYHNEWLKRYAASSLFHPEKLIREYEMKVDAVENRLISNLKSQIQRIKFSVLGFQSKILLQGPVTKIERHRTVVKNASHRMKRAEENILSMKKAEITNLQRVILRINLDEFKNKLSLLQTRLRQMDHRKILERGYALCTNKKGEIILSSQDLTDNENVGIELAEGHLDCKVLGRRL